VALRTGVAAGVPFRKGQNRLAPSNTGRCGRRGGLPASARAIGGVSTLGWAFLLADGTCAATLRCLRLESERSRPIAPNIFSLHRIPSGATTSAARGDLLRAICTLQVVPPPGTAASRFGTNGLVLARNVACCANLPQQQNVPLVTSASHSCRPFLDLGHRHPSDRYAVARGGRA
jgi:hypothetical protein